MQKHIIIGSDHAGFNLKETLKVHLDAQGMRVTDAGCYAAERADYPDTAAAVVKEILNSPEDTVGILCCGSGVGMAMTANRFSGIRAVVCHDLQITRLSRQHNNANVICFGERIIASAYAAELTDAFLATAYEGGRHENRVAKMDSVNSGGLAPCP